MYFLFIFIVLALVVTFTIASTTISKDVRMKRQLKRTPRKSIHQVQSRETVQITGTIELVGEPLIAPLSGRACAQYEVIVERSSPYNRKAVSTETLYREEKAGMYLIREGEHYVYMSQQKMLSALKKDHSLSARFPDLKSKRLAPFNKEHLLEDWQYFNNETYYFEGILAEGEKVIVSGIGEWKSAASLGFPAKYGRVLCIEAAPDGFTIITDDEKWMKYQHEENPS